MSRPTREEVIKRLLARPPVRLRPAAADVVRAERLARSSVLVGRIYRVR